MCQDYLYMVNNYRLSKYIICISLLLPIVLSINTYDISSYLPSEYLDQDFNDTDNMECDLCLFVIKIIKIIKYLCGKGLDYPLIERITTDICIIKRIEKEDVCIGIIKTYGPEIITIVSNAHVPQYICSMAQYCNLTGYTKYSTPYSYHVAKNVNIREKNVKDNEIGFMFHISDLHLDPYYTEGTSTDCGRPVCCHTWWGKGNATQWSGYSCDTSPALFDSMLENMVIVNSNPDYIMYTGDAPPHNIWNQTREWNMNITRHVIERIKVYFPNTTLLYSVGNHELYAASQDPFPPNDQWTFSRLSSIYGKYLPEEARITYASYGYYAINLTDTLSFVSLNSQLFDNRNFWIYDQYNLTTYDPGNQLYWLNNTLHNLQRSNRYVWLASHIPPGDSSSLYLYTDRLLSIYEFYSDIIVNSFHGHTHNDQLRILSNKTGVYGFQFIMSSLVPLYGHNPTFRLYKYDKNNGSIYDYVHHWTNMSKINSTTKVLEWNIEYNASTTYGVDNLLVENIVKLVNDMSPNASMVYNSPYLEEYCKYYDGQTSFTNCTDQIILKHMYCRIITDSSLNYDGCIAA